MSAGEDAGAATVLPDPKQALAQQMTSAGDEEKIEKALSFAALSGRFRPDDALAAAGFPPPEATAAPSLARLAAVARLADACDTRLWQPDWIMRGPARERCIARLDGRVEDVAAWRRRQAPSDKVANDICDALLGAGAFARGPIDAALSEDRDAEAYEQLIRGITMALPLTPARERLDELRAALARAQSRAEPLQAREAGLLGRDDEIAGIVESIARQRNEHRAGGPLTALYLRGVAGTGKSSLLTEIRNLERASGTVCVTLDFTRPGIEGSDPLGLSRETARQLAQALGASAGALYGAIAAASGVAESLSDTPRLRALRLLNEIASLLRQSGRPLLLVLDSLEALTRYGDTSAFGLLEWLRTAKSILPQLAVVGGGRGPFPARFAGEVETLALAGLPDAAARERLAGQPLSAAAAEEVIAFAAGDPLILDLGARLATAGIAPVSATGASTASKAYALYRQIIDRIPDPRGQKLAEAGLLLRQVNPAVLAEVIAPQFGIALSLERAADLLGQFGKNTWLVEHSEDWLIHSAEQRLLLLERQVADHPLRAVRVFRAAAAWHARHGDPVLALYYRLQVFRWQKRPPPVEFATAILFTEEMIGELPRKAQDLLAIVRGERSTRLRARVQKESAATAASAGSDGFDMADAAELRMLLHRRNHAEAAAMVGAVEDFSAIDPASPEAAAIIESLWRAGRRSAARALLDKRRQQLSGVSLVARDIAAMCAAFADLDPEGFRSVLRERRGFGELLFTVSAVSSDAADWDVAGLLLLAEGFPTRSTLAQATWDACTGEPLSAQELSSRADRLKAVRRWAGRPGGAGPDSLLAALLPDSSHARMVQNRLQVLSAERLNRVVPLVAMVREAVGTGTPMPAAASYALDRADELGLLAPVLTALAVLDDDADLADLADAARRRAATVAGRWSYGDVPAVWRQLPTDRQTAEALHTLSSAREPGDAADAAIARWRERFPTLLERGEAIAAGVPLSTAGDDGADGHGIAQRLIEAGVPLVLVPGFTVRALSRSPQRTILDTNSSSSKEG